MLDVKNDTGLSAKFSYISTQSTELVMTHGQYHRVVSARFRSIDEMQSIFLQCVGRVDPWVENVHLQVVTCESTDEIHNPGVANVRTVFLERQAENKHSASYRVDSCRCHQHGDTIGDVFPQAVLVSGSANDLLLLGTTGPRIEIDPDRVAAALATAPAVRADLERVNLGAVHEIVGTFLGSARTLTAATLGAAPVVDDRPVQEYGVRSILNGGHGVPGSIVDLNRVSDWCPRCVVEGVPAPAVQDLGVYLELLALAYAASPAEVASSLRLGETAGRRVAGSAYLGAIVPESAAAHNVLGIALAERGHLDEAIVEFRAATALDPESGQAEWHLGAALASQGANEEATVHLTRSVALEPRNSRAVSDLGLILARQGRFDEAAERLQRAIALDPNAADARRNLALVEQRRGRAPARP